MQISRSCLLFLFAVIEETLTNTNQIKYFLLENNMEFRMKTIKKSGLSICLNKQIEDSMIL